MSDKTPTPTTEYNVAMICLLEHMRDNPGAVSSGAAAGAAMWALAYIDRLRRRDAAMLEVIRHYNPDDAFLDFEKGVIDAQVTST